MKLRKEKGKSSMEKNFREFDPWLEREISPRAVYVAFEAFPRPKGATTHIGSMVSALSREYSPVLLLCCGYGDMPGFQVEGSVTILRFKGYHPNFLERAIGFGKFVFDILKSLKSLPQICVFRDPWGGVPAINALPGVPFVFEVNGLPGWELAYTYPDFSVNAAAKAKINDMEAFCLKQSDRILAVSSVTGLALGSRGVRNDLIQVIPNCAGDVFFRSVPDKINEELPAGIFPDLLPDQFFCYFGSSHPWQGLDTLLRAWSHVESDLPEKKLLMILGGAKKSWKPLRKLVQKLRIEDRVVFHSSLDPERLSLVLSRMAFTCAPLADTERNVVQGCCPIKIVESMAAGVPVLASDLRVCRDLIENEHDGLLVRPGNSRIWANRILDLFRKGEIRRRLGRNARATAERRFSRQVAEKALSGLFRETVRKSQGKRELCRKPLLIQCFEL